MKDFKIGDKVTFKKEVLDKIKKNESAESSVGCLLNKTYHDYVIDNSNFRKLGYFIVQGFGCDKNNLEIAGLYLGKDLFEHYQEDHSYKKGDMLTIGGYKGFISYDSIGYFLDLESQFFTHLEACIELKKLFGEGVFDDIARKCCAINYKGGFPDFKYIEDLVNFVEKLNKLLDSKFVEKLNKLLDSKKESNLTPTKNYQNNEIKFQRAKASSKRGVVPAGSTISGRKDKIAISIGHLSYQVCNC